MKSLSRLCFVACFFALTVCAAWAGQEEAAIEKLITGSARAMTDFPRTRDFGSVSKYYAEDYTGINDGEWETMEDVKKTFSDLEQQLDLGSPVGISYRLADIRVHVTGATAWATYDFSARIGVAGEPLVEEEGKCTGIYRKKGASWTIQHEHCSSKNEAGPEERNNPLETI
ncbi:MAG: nuclear transport factor 2 family protein [Deltaproteobacteria bacterium]|nr:nuclear transport factor 2 family protein [Deltaproteobacteria bacterium]